MNIHRLLFILLLFLAPISLSLAYWPFGDDGGVEYSKDELNYISSLNILDRVDYADKIPGNALIQGHQFRLMAYEPAMMSFAHHFMPKPMYRYYNSMYGEDPNFENSWRKGVYFYPVDNNLFHTLGVDYFIAESNREDYPFEYCERMGEYYVCEDKKALPRFYYVDKVEFMGDNEAVLQRMNTIPYDELVNTAIAYNDNDVDLEVNKTQKFNKSKGAIELVSYTPNYIEFEADSSEEQYLVLTDTFDDRWKVVIDNQEDKIYTTNFMFRGVKIPFGHHMVRFIYSYPSFKIYVLIAVMTAVLCVWVALALYISTTAVPTLKR